MTAHVEMETCDQCGPSVVAYIIVEMPSGLPLSYCIHHGREYEGSLLDQGAYVFDYSYILTGDNP